jgi:hypothetical protein
LEFEGLDPLNLRNIAGAVEAFVLRVNAAVPKTANELDREDVREALPLPDRPSIAVLAATRSKISSQTEWPKTSSPISLGIVCCS